MGILAHLQAAGGGGIAEELLDGIPSGGVARQGGFGDLGWEGGDGFGLGFRQRFRHRHEGLLQDLLVLHVQVAQGERGGQGLGRRRFVQVDRLDDLGHGLGEDRLDGRGQQPLDHIPHGEHPAAGQAFCPADDRPQPLGAKAVAGGAARAMDRFGHRSLLAFRAG